MTKEEILDNLKVLIADRLGVELAEITPDKTLKDLHADSLDSVEVMMEVEKMWNIAIADSDMERFTNIQSIVDYIELQTKQ